MNQTEIDSIMNGFLNLMAAEKKSVTTIEYYRIHIIEFLQFCSFINKPVDEDSATEFIITKSAHGAKKGNSIRTYYFVLKTFLRYYLKKDGKDIKIRFKLPKVQIEPPKYFKIEEIVQLLRNAQGKHIHYAFLRAMIATMARRNEIWGLEKNDLKIIHIKKENGEEKDYYVINFRQEISKSEGREIVVDKVTWNILKEQADLHEDKRIFHFTSRTGNNIVTLYKPYGSRGSCHAIRHGVSRFIKSRTKYMWETQVKEYYLGHNILKDMEGLYSSMIHKPDGTIDYERLFEFYKDYSPIMVFVC